MNIVDKLWNVVLANKNKSNNLFIIASEGKWTDTSCDMCVDDMFTVIDWIENKYSNKTIKKNFGQVNLHSQLETYYKEQS
jgi:hypothetical protein